MLIGLPDLDQPLHGAPGLAWRAFGRNGLVVVVPDRLRLETDANGRPQLLLTLIRGVDSGGAARTTGRLEVGLSVECDLEGTVRTLATAASPCRLDVAELEGGTFMLAASLGAIAPVPIAPVQSLPPDLLTRARVVVDLDPGAAVIASRLIDDASLPLVATMQLAFRAVAPRIALAASFDPRAVAERLAARFGSGANVSEVDLHAALDALLLDAVLVDLEGDAHAIDAQRRAGAVGLRMKQRYARPSMSAPGLLQLLAPHDVPSGRERIDFNAAAAVLAEQTVSLDPLSVARSMQPGGLDAFVRRVEMPAVPTGRERIVLTANLPEPIAGLQSLVADFRAPPLPPFRPPSVSASVSLDAANRCGETEVRLAPGEQLAGEVRLRAMLARNGQMVEVAGPWRVLQNASMLLGPLDFGAPLVVVRASQALLAIAVVEVLTGDGHIAARLDAATSMTALPLDASPAPNDAPLRIVARPLGGGRDIEIDATGRKRIDIDVSTLPGFGVQRARLLSADASSLFVEWRPDSDAEDAATQSVRIGADRPIADIAWIAASPFRPGVVWREVRSNATGPWSAPVWPADDLPVDIDLDNRRPAMSDSMVIDGMTLRPKPGRADAWTYLPLRPTLERAANGKPLLQVIEAGSAAFMQCTAQVALNNDARDALLARLKESKPNAQSLEAAPLTVERIALEVRSDGERWTTLAESKGSGNAPWTAAFAASLDAGALAAIKAAVAGERDFARLAARIALPGSPVTTRLAAASSDTRIETPSGSASASVAMALDASSTARDATSIDLAKTDIADLFRSAAQAAQHNAP